MTTREEFIEEWKEKATPAFPELEADVIAKMGEQLWMGREINYAVGDEDLNVVAHRYFHGVGSIKLQLLMMLPQIQLLPITSVLLLLAEHLFHYGFACGLAEGRGVVSGDSLVDIAPLDEVLNCLQGREPILSSREELDQETSLPTLERTDELQGMLPPGFEGTAPDEEGGEYF